MRHARMQGRLTGSKLAPGAERTDGAAATISMTKLDLDGRPTTGSPPSTPMLARFPLGTHHSLRLPINSELVEGEGLSFVRLPTIIGRHRTDQLDAVLRLTIHKRLRRPIGGIHQMGNVTNQ
jgi:hypothetical protein